METRWPKPPAPFGGAVLDLEGGGAGWRASACQDQGKARGSAAGEDNERTAAERADHVSPDIERLERTRLPLRHCIDDERSSTSRDCRVLSGKPVELEAGEAGVEALFRGKRGMRALFHD